MNATPAGQADSANPPRADLGPGALLAGRYRLDAEIGRGGMGIIYRAHDLPNDRDVAVKVINLDTANALARGQFEREAEIGARLKHPHIVAVYETGVAETGAPFMVMELVHGTSLDEMPGLTYARIIDIGKQICEVLEYAHGQGLVYRDLKPGNVILEKRGFGYFVKLLDFGLARPRGEAYLPNESNLAGTVFYLAPEVIAGQPADVGADLYALGATLYEMVTGRLPFSNFDEHAILTQHLEEQVAPPSHSRHDVPPALEAIILRLLAKDPCERFASAQETRDALNQVEVTREADAARGNLPAQVDSAGREEQVALVRNLLEAHKLVTMLDGDLTLALVVGSQLAEHFPDGVWLVDLSQVNEPMHVLQTVASTLGVNPDPNRPLTVSLMQALREKNLLLLLGPCAHVAGACAQLVETVLRTCPDVHILAVSQKPLNLPAEHCHHRAS